MTLDGEGRRPTWQHMLRLARRASIDEKTARAIVDEVRTALARWPREARAVEVAPATISDIGRRLDAVAAEAELPGSAPKRPRHR
ncbi:hypothetical protein [Nannocystis pusilla]|uniref:hypothetical protein n=1 Tax=Nannocystis pusilla TaxID=889268 RepID=UPI003B7F3788